MTPNEGHIEYLKYLPGTLFRPAVDLYFYSLREKLEPLLGGDGRAQEVLMSSIVADNCLVALCNGKLVGIMGFQTSQGGFIQPSLKTMVRIYGMPGGLFRLAGLAMLYHSTRSDEFYIDGVAVAPEMRGKGIGRHFFGILESMASEAGKSRISLDVIDINDRARALYEKLGYKELNRQKIWPVNRLIGFPFGAVSYMEKSIG